MATFICTKETKGFTINDGNTVETFNGCQTTVRNTGTGVNIQVYSPANVAINSYDINLTLDTLTTVVGGVSTPFVGTNKDTARLLLNNTILFYDANGGAGSPVSATDVTTSGTGLNFTTDAEKRANALRANFLNINDPIGFFGDSITQRGLLTSGVNQFYGSGGYLAWAMQAINFKLDMPAGAMGGVSGDTTTQMLARIGTYLAANKLKVVTVLGGTNDANASASAATIIGNLNSIYQAILASGAKVIAITILPRYSPVALTGPQETVRQTVNTWIISQASADIIVINAETPMTGTGLYVDGLHPSSAGSFILGGLVATQLNNLIALINGKSTALYGTDTNILLNGNLLAGTGGSTSGGATGTVATNFILQNTNGGGATVAGSKTNTNNLFQQRILISGAKTSTSRYTSLLQQLFTLPADFGAGDWYQGYVDYEIQTAPLNIQAIYNQHTIANAGFTVLTAGYGINSDGSNPDLPLGVGRYQVKTAPFFLPNGIPTVSETYFNILYKDGSVSVGLDLLVHEIGLVKIKSGARRTIADASATMLATDSYVGYTSLTATRPYTLLAASLMTGKTVTVKDESGNAGAFPVTGVGTVNGVVNPTLINSPYGSYTLYSNGTAWLSVGTVQDIVKSGVLSSTNSINAKTIANTVLYTVPAGKTAIITQAIIRCTAATAITVGPTVNIFNSVASDVYSSTALTALTTAGLDFGFTTTGMSKTAAAASTISLGLTVASTGTSQVLSVELIGYLI